LHIQIDPEEATLLALDLQDMLEASLVQWSQHNPQLLLAIKGSFGRLEEVRYKEAIFPVFRSTSNLILYTAPMPPR